MPARLQALGEKPYPQITLMQPERAGKITGMLLEIDNSDLVHMLEDQTSLKGKVNHTFLIYLLLDIISTSY